MRKELESRLVSLSVIIEKICKGLIKSYMSEHLSKQIIRSSTSAALNYGEAQAAESRNDFIHKIGIVLKELRETQISLHLLSGSIKENQIGEMQASQKECDELVAIFHKTVMTAKSNNRQ
jgi:four helix bundle protein